MKSITRRAPVDLWRITSADLIVRTAYQIGKTPLLPLYAAALGAGEFLLGAIISVSTMSGLFLKPLFGWLSDRGGRKLWLLLGLALFAGVPFLYAFVHTPEQLFGLRLVHGLATAIFGPVSVAYVAEMASMGIAERLGWFGMARSGGYLLAPLLAVWLLAWVDAVSVFMIIGFISCFAFLPVLKMGSSAAACGADKPAKAALFKGFGEACRLAVSNTALWLAGLLEMLVYIATYAIKAFLPLYAIYAAGFELLLVGIFFSVQEAAHMLMRPWGGRLGDRYGYDKMISAGLSLAALGLMLLPVATMGIQFVGIAIMLGIGQGLIFPSTLAFASSRINALHLGTGLGFLGTMGNIGKVIGPAAVGFLLSQSDYRQVFHLLAFIMLTAALAIFIKRGVYTPWQSSKS